MPAIGTRNGVRALFAATVGFATVGLVVLATLSAVLELSQRCAGAPGGGPATRAAGEIPPRLLGLYRAAERRYGVAWNVLAAINKVETDFGRNLAVSSAGAIGWMQFMPATWARFGLDGDHDGRADPDDPIPAAARYLRAAGARRDLDSAIFAYNHSAAYVQQVLALARSYARGPLPTATTAAASVAALGDACAAAATGPTQLAGAVTLARPRRFAVLPRWAMAGGRAPEQIDARILADLLWILRTYGLRVTAAREVGHNTHGDGTAADMVPAAGAGQRASDRSALRLAHDIGWTQRCAASGVAPACPLAPWVRFVGYNGYPAHGDPAHAGPMAHIHVSWLASHYGASALTSPNAWVRAFAIA